MNIVVQNILVGVVVAMALSFLIKKFFWKPKLSTAKKDISPSCGNGKCGCH